MFGQSILTNAKCAGGLYRFGESFLITEKV